MAGKFTDQQILEYWQAFSVFDENGDGTISTEELGHVMKALGQDLTEEEVQAMITEIDADGNGKVDFQEFLSLIVPSKPETCREEELLEAFAAFDTDGNGYISREELKAGLEVIGETVTDEELSDLIKIIDSDDDGEIRYTEFVQLMASR